MRIVAGRFRGRPLMAPPAGHAIRPTADRLRESLFNVLAHGYGDAVAEARVIDLFAGTGALGLEALSRGARFVLFVDDGPDARALLRDNVERLGVGGTTRIFRRDATALGAAPPGERFDLAFLDPPYRKGLGERALASLAAGGWLAADALCVLEESDDAEVSIPDGFTIVERRVSSGTAVTFLRFNAAP